MKKLISILTVYHACPVVRNECTGVKLIIYFTVAAFLTFGVLGTLSAHNTPLLPLLGGTNKVDSLLKALKTTTHDTSKIKTLNRLSSALWRTGEYKKALHYANKALGEITKYEVRSTNKIKQWLKKVKAAAYNNIAIINRRQDNYPKALDYYTRSLKLKRQLNDKTGIARAYGNIAIIYKRQGNYPKALDHYTRCLKLFRQLNDKASIAIAYNNIANIYMEKGNYPKALDLFIRSLKLSRQLNDKAGISRTYNNIAIIYKRQGNYPQALDHYSRSLKLSRQINDKDGIARTYNNIAIIYDEQGNYTKALDLYNRSLKLNRQLNDKYGIASNYNNIGSLYTTLPDSVPVISRDSTERLYERAMELQQKSLRITKEIGAAEGMTYALNGIGALYMKQQLFEKAVNYYERSAQIADSIGAKPQMVEAYEKLAVCSWQLAKFKVQSKKADLLEKAYEYHVKYAKVKEEVFNEEKNKEMGRQEMAHEYELEKIDRQQKEKEVAAAKASNYNMQYMGMLIGIFAVFITVFFLANILMPDWLVNLVSWIPFVMLFELTLVYTDPYVEILTGDQPFYKFLINTAIAIMLFFVQNYFQNKLKQRMYRIRKLKVKRRSKIQAQSGKEIGK